MPAAMQAKRIGAGGAGKPHRRGRGVLFVVRVQDEDAVHGAGDDRVRLVLFAGHREAHAQEVGGVVEIVLRINEGLPDRIFVGHRRQRRHFGDHADRCDHALGRVGDVGGVVIEGGQRADAADHHGHRMCIAAETLKEPAHLLVDHRVMDHAVVEVFLLRGGRQFAVEQEVAGLEKVAVLGQILDRIAAVEQHALVAVDIGDLGLAARGRRKARVVGEDVGLVVELADVHDLRADRALVQRERVALVAECQLAGPGGGAGLRVHDRTSICEGLNSPVHAA